MPASISLPRYSNCQPLLLEADFSTLFGTMVMMKAWVQHQISENLVSSNSGKSFYQFSELMQCPFLRFYERLDSRLLLWQYHFLGEKQPWALTQFFSPKLSFLQQNTQSNQWLLFAILVISDTMGHDYRSTLAWAQYYDSHIGSGVFYPEILIWTQNEIYPALHYIYIALLG